MNNKRNTKVYYYKTYNDELVQSKKQEYKLRNNYKWIHNNIIYRLFASILYCVAYIISFFYGKIFLCIKIKNKNILRKYKKQGYFLYGNHTQMIGDVFIPAHVCGTKRIYTLVSPANLGIPVIGRLLPMIGAIPIPDNIKDTKKMLAAIEKRIRQKKCVVIYPEAHIWPYYTKIRPFPKTSFKFPVNCNSPLFVMTTTYAKKKLGKKPKITVYVDGPFLPDSNLNQKENEEKLCNEVYNCMKNRSKNSTYEYIEYKGEKQ